MALTRDELINLCLLTLIGLLTGVGSFVFRRQLPAIFNQTFVQFEYSLAVILLGGMPLLLWQAKTTEGRATALYLLIALLISVVIEPQRILLNAMLGATVTVNGIAYFRFYGNSNVYLLGFIAFLLVELYLYVLYVTWQAVTHSGTLRTGFIGIFLTFLLWVVGRMFKREYTVAVS